MSNWKSPADVFVRTLFCSGIMPFGVERLEPFLEATDVSMRYMCVRCLWRFGSQNGGWPAALGRALGICSPAPALAARASGSCEMSHVDTTPGRPQQLLKRLTPRKLLSLCSARRVGVGSRTDPAMRFCNEKGAGGPPSPVLDV